MTTARWLTPILLLALLTGCSIFTKYGRMTAAAKRSLDNGDYAAAIISVCGALKIKPQYKTAQDLAPTLVPTAKQRLIDRITQTRQASATFVNDATVDQRQHVLNDCTSLVHAMQEAASMPPYVQESTGQTISFPYEDYTSWVAEAQRALADAKQKAAEQHYQRGVQLAASENLEGSRQAAAEFKKAMFFVPNYKDSMMKYMGARSAATLQVGLLGVDTESVWPLGTAIGEPTADGIMSGLAEKCKDLEFTMFVDRKTIGDAVQNQQVDLERAYGNDQTAAAIGKQLGLDQVIVVSVTTLKAPDAATANATHTDRKQIQYADKVYTDSNGQQHTTPQYGNVQATVTTKTKTASANATLTYKLIDCATGKLVDKGQASGQTTWKGPTWGSYTGDAQALSPTSQQLVNRSEPTAPAPAALAKDATKDAVAKIVAALAPRFK